MAGKPSQSINLGLPVLPEVDDQQLFAALVPIYNAIRNTMNAVDTYTGNVLVTPDEYSQVNAFGQLLLQKQAILFVKLTEDVSAGHMINLYNSSGLRARKAIVSSQPCHAYATVGGKAGEHIPVCMFGYCGLVSGLTIGATYYMSSTAGLITNGATAQKLGIALSTNAIWFNPQ